MKHYQTPAAIAQRTMPVAVAQQLVGSDEEKRVRKTYIPDRFLTVRLAVVANHTSRIARTLWDMRNTERAQRGEPPEDYDFERAQEIFSAVRTWKEFHDWLIEHLANMEGFVVKAAVRAEMLREAENRAQAAIPASPGTNGGGF